MNKKERLQSIIQDLEEIVDTLLGAPVFDPPIGDPASPTLWPGHWVDANPYGTRYALGYHTGADLNLNKPHWDADYNKPVRAAADGIVTYAKYRTDSWGKLVVIQHTTKVFSRYAHLEEILVEVGQQVRRGDIIGRVGGTGGHPNHLHFDISTSGILGVKPDHWPGWSYSELVAHYVDPKKYIEEHRAHHE